MGKFDFGYSTKNISLPSQNDFLQRLVEKKPAVSTQNALESLLLPQPWCDHPLQRHIRLQVYQEPPSDRRAKEIWRWYAKNNTIDEIKTSKQPFSQQTQRRHRTHKNETKLLIAADKTTNFYKLEPSIYNDLLEQNITKSYKKAQPNTTRAIHWENKNIITKLALDDRVDTTANKDS